MRTRRLSFSLGAIMLSALSMSGCSGSADTTGLQTDGGITASGGSGNTGNSGFGNAAGFISTTGGTGGGSTETDAGNPCTGPNPPSNCHMVASGPACGDGQLNQDSEVCDDGNTLPGDGCSGICKVEPNWDCTTPGQPCVFKYACGNGKLEPGEVCDDGNTVDGDGCNATCDTQSADFVCTTPGEPCTRVSFCGDKHVKGTETCDDGNTTPGDGCDATCQKEEGWLCLIPGQPCTKVEVCGDGKVSVTKGEVCDDGNTTDGDGCTANCLAVESGWACPTPGQPCTNLVRCGDGIVNGTETCDDANTDPNDGCNACVKAAGYECPFAGAKCIALCGDGLIVGTETCDDGNTLNGDGCNASCRWESGLACTGAPGSVYTCHQTVCGDGTKEGGEGCDDGNLIPNDGCDSKCRPEPPCTAGAGCTAVCGDGLVVNEECDDGNLLSGDGCSSTCKRETGYTCSNNQPCETLNGSCILRVPIVYRDFIDKNNGGHPDFQVECGTLQTGVVKPLLNAKGLPDLLSNDNACIQDATSFAEWYDFSLTGAWGSSPIVGEMVLWDNGSGGYVNRYGADGTRWGAKTVTNYTNTQWCSNDSNDCAACGTLSSGEVCLPTCTPWNSTATCRTTITTTTLTGYDGNPLFFPVDETVLGARGAVTPLDQYAVAGIPEEVYGGGWNTDPSGTKHNFAFTSHVRYWFNYDSSKSYQLDFTGDDDVWVFINGILAVDLGGLHVPTNGSVTLDTTKASELKLASGNVYQIDVFQAERKQVGSSYRLTLSGFSSSPSVCIPTCGDGIVTPGEQCDDGVLNGTGYGKCQTDCTRTEYCGDGILQANYEQCDNGTNTSSYGETGCAPGCVTPPRCGDGAVQTGFGEQCDNGSSKNTGEYGGCTNTCQRASWCGDGVTDTANGEQCDDGVNDGTYGNCAPGCVTGPRCGDGITQSDFGEQCDDGNTTNGDGCSTNCKLEGVCGDAFVQSSEQCDDGVNDGGYGECAPGCVIGPHCGDGVVQKDHEQCDDGVNGGGYGECAPGCVLGPHCGDGVVQPTYEECDDGNATSGDGCSSACKQETSTPA